MEATNSIRKGLKSHAKKMHIICLIVPYEITKITV